MLACASTIEITCDILCKTDGDERGIIISDKCYCANSRDMGKFVVRVPKQGTGRTIYPDQKFKRYDGVEPW